MLHFYLHHQIYFNLLSIGVFYSGRRWTDQADKTSDLYKRGKDRFTAGHSNLFQGIPSIVSKSMP